MTTSFQGSAQVKRDILTPHECKALHPSLAEPIWVYRYTHLKQPWTFSVGTHIQPGTMPGSSGSLSLGGFRVVPAERAAAPGFSSEREALELSLGMEEKVFWSRLIGVGGPLGIKNLGRIVGGKCVLLTNDDGRVGKKRDYEALDFAIECLNDFEAHSGVFVVTGQDLGHGVMSDGKCTSLEYLNKNFRGAVLADTSKPTAEGNFYMLKGMLQSIGLELSAARVALVGVGNIGLHVLKRIKENSGKVIGLEAQAKRRDEVVGICEKVFAAEQRAELFKENFDALVLNANAGSLNAETIAALCANPGIKIVNGCENLVMPDPEGEKKLLAARKTYCHTELCGMMGYLTAVEEYLSKLHRAQYKVEDMFEASKKLEQVGLRGSRAVYESNFQKSFTDCVRDIYGH